MKKIIAVGVEEVTALGRSRALGILAFPSTSLWARDLSWKSPSLSYSPVPHRCGIWEPGVGGEAVTSKPEYIGQDVESGGARQLTFTELALGQTHSLHDLIYNQSLCKVCIIPILSPNIETTYSMRTRTICILFNTEFTDS